MLLVYSETSFKHFIFWWLTARLHIIVKLSQSKEGVETDYISKHMGYSSHTNTFSRARCV